MASEMIERVANAMREAADVGSETMYEDMASAAIEALTTDDLLKEILIIPLTKQTRGIGCARQAGVGEFHRRGKLRIHSLGIHVKQFAKGAVVALP